MDIRPVDPAGAAEAAAAILAEAWQPPCLDYPTDYLRWEFTAPGPPAVTVLADDGGEPAGFGAALPRRVRVGGAERYVYLVTFVAVRPGWQGRGVGGAVKAAVMAAVRPTDCPIVSFAQAGAGAEVAVLRSYERAGWVLRPLGECRVHAASIPPGDPPGPDAVLDGPLPPAPVLPGPDILTAAPTAADLDHLRSDPRPRATVVSRGPGGEVVAAAAVVRSPVRTPQGPALVTQVDRLWVGRGAGPGALQKVIEAAGRRWPDPAGRTVVTVSNVSGLDPAALRAANIRQTHTVYRAYVAGPDPSDPILQATGTDLPVV